MDRDIVCFIGSVGSGKSMIKTIMREFFKGKLEEQGIDTKKINLHSINEFGHLKQIAQEDEARRLHEMTIIGDGEETFEITHQDAYEEMWERCLDEVKKTPPQEGQLILFEHAAGKGPDQKFDQSCHWLTQDGPDGPRLPEWLLERAVFVHIDTVFNKRLKWNAQKSVEVEDPSVDSSRVPKDVLEGRFKEDDWSVLKSYLEEKKVSVFEVDNTGKNKDQLKEHVLEVAVEVWQKIHHEGQIYGEYQRNRARKEAR